MIRPRSSSTGSPGRGEREKGIKKQTLMRDASGGLYLFICKIPLYVIDSLVMIEAFSQTLENRPKDISVSITICRFSLLLLSFCHSGERKRRTNELFSHG